MTRRDIARWAAWIVIPLAGMIWMATWYRNNWYYYDEWSTIDRSLGSWSGMFAGHQGHLQVFSYIVYRIQRMIFGLEGHQVVWLALMGSVALMQVSFALLLRRLGLSTVFALLASAVVTYFGPGGQNIVWEFMWNVNLALALCFLSAVLVLRVSETQAATRATAITIAVLLVLAAAADSGVAIVGSVYVGILLLLSWPKRLTVIALVPAAVANLAWLVLGEDSVSRSAPFDQVFKFASRLFFLGAGGLVGGGETRSLFEGTPSSPTIPLSGAWVGFIAFVLASAGVAYGLWRHRLERKVIVGIVAGVSTAVFGAASIAASRAWLITPPHIPGSRYVQWIAQFLLLAFAPALAIALRPSAEQARRIVSALAAAGLVAVFVINLGQLGPVRRSSEQWGQDVKTQVGWAITVLSEGCGKNQEPDPHAMPIPDLAPQITVDELQRVLADGSLTPQFGIPPARGTRAAVCRPIKAAR